MDFNDRRPRAVPKTKAQLHDHLVDEHGHDDMQDNPGMRRWKLDDYHAQHDEAHADWINDHDHAWEPQAASSCNAKPRGGSQMEECSREEGHAGKHSYAT